MKFLPLLFSLLITVNLNSQNKPAYRIFTGDGKKATYGDIVKSAAGSDVIFFGELHDNPIAHWLELELTKSLFEKKGQDLVLAAEMFETDNQLIIDEYLEDLIKEASFEGEVRKWKNYTTDYKPLLDFAKKNGLKFVASNVPRHYSSMVAADGFEALQKVSPEGLKFIAPLPIDYDPDLPCYKDILTMKDMPKDHNSENLAKAQAIKDATMANFIVKYRKPGQMVIHFNGSYHSERYMGILWYLNKYSPGLKVTTITTMLQDTIVKMDKEGRDKADFIIVVPEDMTRTY